MHSMTAFARSTIQTHWGELCWEIRSVNHRYLEQNLRLPEELRGLEPRVRERINHRLRRGKCDAVLRFQAQGDGGQELSLDLNLARQLVRAAEQLAELSEDGRGLSTAQLLQWPGILQAPPLDAESLSEEVIQLLDTALTQLLAHRAREGEQIAALIERRCVDVLAEVDQVRAILPDILQAQRERLLARLEEARQKLDAERLEQEMLLLAQKMDVAEELERLETHVKEVRQTIANPGTIGRRLDFLMQEMNREANTLGSKSIHEATTLASVNLKVLIEQMREQIQNVE